MPQLLSVYHAIQDFVDQGGPVLWVLFATCLLLWLLILERLWFLRLVWPRRAPGLVAQWLARDDRWSWRAKKFARPWCRKCTCNCTSCCR